jgi:Protein of unknown function (DUF2586)
MPLPNVKVLVTNGALGRTATTADGVAGLVIPATAKPNLPLYSPKLIFSLKEAEAMGLTQANDATENIDAWQQIKEFYDEAGNGASLYFMTYPMERTITQMCDPTNTGTNSVRTLLDYAEGRIVLLAIGRYINPTVVYNQVTQGGIDQDVHTAMPKLNALSLEYMANFAPFCGIIDGRGWNGVVGDLTDLHTYQYPKVSVMLGGSALSKKSASVGLALGRLAKLPVQRNVGRVKDGGVNVTTPTFTSGESVRKYSIAQMNSIHDNGYLFFRRYPAGLASVYFNDDPTATTSNDDFLTIANNRVIHKAIKVVYATYVNELNDEVLIGSEGKIAPTQIRYLEEILKNGLRLQMFDRGEISDFDVTIDPNQNILSNDKVLIVTRIVPVGHTKFIEIELGYSNPAQQ